MGVGCHPQAKGNIWGLIGLVVICSLVVLLWGMVPPASAQSVQDLQRRQHSMEQERSHWSKERDRLQNLEKATHSSLSGLHHSLTATTTQIQTTTVSLHQANQHLRRLEGALAKAETAYRQKQSATVARLRFLQRQPLDRGWAVLLQSQNLTEFLDRRHNLKQVYRSDRQMLVSLRDQADRLERQRQQVEQKRNDIALLQQKLLAQKGDLESLAAYQQETITRLQTDIQAARAAEAQLEKDSRTLARFIRQRVAVGGLTLRGSGRMVYPTSGEITSGFGWRMHPILGYRRFHAGVDFGADYGTVIQAADSGTVILAGWYGGYGNTVIIDHGGGLTSLYGHTSELYVSEGQAVQRGQAIAAVGSTGLSTGPHLHFEVRQNGEPTDPMAFL